MRFRHRRGRVVGRNVAGHGHRDEVGDLAPAHRVDPLGQGNAGDQTLLRRQPPDRIVVVEVPPVLAGVGGVVLPVVGAPTIAPQPAEGGSLVGMIPDSVTDVVVPIDVW